MSNEYYDPPDQVESGSRARASSVNSVNTATDDAFDSLPADLTGTSAEVIAGRDGETSLLAKNNQQDVAIAALAAGSGIVVSAADTTAGFVDGKFTSDGSIEYNIESPGGNETMNLSVDDSYSFFAAIGF